MEGQAHDVAAVLYIWRCCWIRAAKKLLLFFLWMRGGSRGWNLDHESIRLKFDNTVDNGRAGTRRRRRVLHLKMLSNFDFVGTGSFFFYAAFLEKRNSKHVMNKSQPNFKERLKSYCFHFGYVTHTHYIIVQNYATYPEPHQALGVVADAFRGVLWIECGV